MEIRSLHDLYPGYAIDVEAEQRAPSACSIVVWQHPLYWYTAPALLKHWFEQVLTFGWAHGPGGHALQGERCLWITTTGADAESCTPAGVSAHEFEAFVPVVRQTARFCGMRRRSRTTIPRQIRACIPPGRHDLRATARTNRVRAKDRRRRRPSLFSRAIVGS